MRLRDAACEYAIWGWSILPLRPGSKAPLGLLVPHGKDEATSNAAQVFEWWERQPRANIGLYCRGSGLLALDVDPRHGGDDSLHRLRQRIDTPPTVESLSGGGGCHLLYRHPGVPVVGVMAPGIDVKDDGYIALPPSIHPNGQQYHWSVDAHPSDRLPAKISGALLKALQVRKVEHGTLPRPVTNEPFRRVSAATYIEALTGRTANGDGFIQCPFHKNGDERTPSLKPDGLLWACYGCPPPPNKRVMGGNVYDFAGYCLNLPMPLRGVDFLEARAFLASRLRCA